MCDWSLEMYDSRPATVGEELETRRFPTGCIGLVGRDDNCPVCVQPGTKLTLIQNEIVRDVVFHQREKEDFIYRDGFKDSNGTFDTFQSLLPKTKVVVGGLPVQNPDADGTAHVADKELATT